MNDSNCKYSNQTGCNCCSWWCSSTAEELAKSLGTVGAALIQSKLGKKNAPAQPPASTNNQPPPKKSIFTAKNIAIGGVVGIVIIGSIAAGIYVVKKKTANA